MARVGLGYASAAMIAFALAQCGGSPEPSTEPPTPDAATVSCRDAVLDRTDPHWRERSTGVGPFGLYGDGRDFADAWRDEDGDLITKIPAVVAGQTPVTVRASPDERNRILLHYSGHRPAEAVTFEPCADQARTSWPGGLVLETRQPATVEVRVGDGQPKTLVVGRSTS